MFLPGLPFLGSQMRRVKAEEAIGKPLAHDIMRYGAMDKPVLFKRGHVVRSEDLKVLKDTGNYSVYIIEGGEEGVHEDEAATRMARASVGENVSCTKPDNGRVAFRAERPGLLELKPDVIKQINLIDDFLFITLADKIGVRKQQIVGMVKTVPLAVGEKRMVEVEQILEENRPVLKVTPPRIKKIAAVVTGIEVYEGKIRESFVPILEKKLGEYGLSIQESVVVPDDEEKIRKNVLEFKQRGYELILVTGGMAVDAADVSPSAIRSTGAEVVSYGVPASPGAMIMIAYLGSTPILGVSAGAIADKRTSLDRILPRILAGEKMGKEDLAEIGPGGFLLRG